jgi:ubiquinone biosynthesis protein
MLFGRRERGVTKLRRYREILTKLARYGFAEVAGALAASRRSPFTRTVRRPSPKLRRLDTGTRIRMLCEELGSTFVKLGQLLSLRSDILPDEITEELSRLQNGVAPVPFDRIAPVLEKEIGLDWRSRLTGIDETPVASASVAQVYRARDLQGNELAVKIQRPGIDRVVAVDFSILRDLAALLERYVPRSRPYHPVQIIEQFTKVLTLELDFTYEGRTMELFRERFRRDRALDIPRVFWELTTGKVLAMEYVEGISLSRMEEVEAAGLNKKAIADVGARYVLTQVFRDGIYNADPHPGNFIVRRDGVLVPLDFGMVGTLDEEMRDALVDLVLGFAGRDAGKLLRAFTSFDLLGENVNLMDFRQELSRLIHYYGNIPLAHLAVGRMFGDLTALIRQYHVSLPPDFALTTKVLVTLETLGKRLDPSFNIVEAAKPYVRKARLRRMTRWRDPQRNLDVLEDADSLVRALPAEIHDILRKLRAGRLKVRLEVYELEDRVREIDKSINRLTFAIVIAGSVIASAYVSRTPIGPQIFGLPVLGVAGFLLAAVLGIWLLVGIFRSGRL